MQLIVLFSFVIVVAGCGGIWAFLELRKQMKEEQNTEED